jgi:hypothetical protein
MTIEQSLNSESLDVNDHTFLEKFNLEIEVPASMPETMQKSRIADRLSAIERRIPGIELEIGEIEERTTKGHSSFIEHQELNQTIHSCEIRAHLSWKEILKFRRVTEPNEYLDPAFKQKVYNELSDRLKAKAEINIERQEFESTLPQKRLFYLPACATSLLMSCFGLQVTYYSYIATAEKSPVLIASFALANAASVLHTFKFFKEYFALNKKQKLLDQECSQINQEIKLIN